MTADAIIELANVYGAHTGLADRTVSERIGRHSRFIQQLREHGSCHLRSIPLALAGFRRVWPADLEWPLGVCAPDDQQTRECA